MKLLFTFSLLLNLVLASFLLFTKMQGCAETPDGRLGTLSRDIQIGYFGSDKTIFKLPKGLVVRDASATGADWFEPYRFRLVITSSDETLIDYSANIQPKPGQHGEYYSADVIAHKRPNAETQSQDRRSQPSIPR
jgi:hypothetical protein